MPTFGEVAELITALAAAGAMLASLRNHRKINETQASIQEIKISVDGRLEQLLALTSTSQHALGVKDERDRRREQD
jgi:hypothetical protein